MTPTQATLDLAPTSPPARASEPLYRAYHVSNAALGLPRGIAVTARQRLDAAAHTYQRTFHVAPHAALVPPAMAEALGTVEHVTVHAGPRVPHEEIWLEVPR